MVPSRLCIFLLWLRLPLQTICIAKLYETILVNQQFFKQSGSIHIILKFFRQCLSPFIVKSPSWEFNIEKGAITPHCYFIVKRVISFKNLGRVYPIYCNLFFKMAMSKQLKITKACPTSWVKTIPQSLESSHFKQINNVIWNFIWAKH